MDDLMTHINESLEKVNMDDLSKKRFKVFVETLRKISKKPIDDLMLKFSEEVCKATQNPYNFEPYHTKITHPFDYSKFCDDFIKISLDFENSKVIGQEKLKAIKSHLEQGENVIFFANHQIEPDPQVILSLFSEACGTWVNEMIFVAGDRVTRDPVAIPFSLGCNLLCIYSKKYIDTPKELKEQKLLHNKKTLKKMEELLCEGGKMIYVAPSGGRDRKDAHGNLVPAPFDPNSIELFLLISSIAKKPTHFYPLALHTYDLLPPPTTTQIDLGEDRIPKYAPAFIAIGDEIDKTLLQEVPKELGKDERRAKRTEIIYNAVLNEYSKIITDSKNSS